MTDYGYGDAQPDYGYGDTTDYGYGATDSTDYGYGAPDTTDYGYGAPDTTDYGYGGQDMGYGDGAPDMGYGDGAPDMGYGDTAPAPAPPKSRRPRRRCSVTKFSLEEASKTGGSQEAEMLQQLNSAQMIQNFRNAGARAPPHHSNSEYSTDSKSSTR